MRILFVAMSHSIHTARWISQLEGQGHEVHLFPSESNEINPALRHVKLHDGLFGDYLSLDPSVQVIDDVVSFPKNFRRLVRGFLRRLDLRWNDRAWRLSRVTRMIQPDIVHSMEIQHAGYLTLQAQKYIRGKFPKWIVTIWGSDIYLFGRLKKHIEPIKAVLSKCDLFVCECGRDISLARNLGYQGKVLQIAVTGGYDINRIRQLRPAGLTSQRRVILVKGYQNFSGRALVALRALELCADVLNGYRIAIHLSNDVISIAAELMSKSTGISVDLIPQCSLEEMLKWHGMARISIGLSISDGLSCSLLEAMLMGSYPIQSDTSCASEWIQGDSVSFVPPNDPHIVAAAIRRAIGDDALVDRSAIINIKLTEDRLDRSKMRADIVGLYETLNGDSRLGPNHESKKRQSEMTHGKK